MKYGSGKENVKEKDGIRDWKYIGNMGQIQARVCVHEREGLKCSEAGA